MAESKIPRKRRDPSRQMLNSEWKLAYTLREAAEATGLSVDTLRRALHTTDPRSFPPPLYVKNAGRKHLVLKPELQRWLDSLPDV